jgi:hypothetical protein
MEMVKLIPKTNKVSMMRRITEKKTITIQDPILSLIIMINNQSLKIIII